MVKPQIKEAALEVNHTDRQYNGLASAYAYLNTALFKGSLPYCLITLQRHKGAYGYFSPNRFTSLTSGEVDEIAMNPQGFVNRTKEEVLSTLAHEMVHLWQQHFGKPPKGNYHNKEWGAKMKEIGLHPSSTGEKGGKETGARVSHYILKGGAFDVACADFLKNDFTLYGDNKRDEAKAKAKAASKTKYTCPDCDTNAWAKPNTHIHCGDCNVAMVAEEKED